MIESVRLEWNNSTITKLTKDIPDEIVHRTASIFLDLVIPTIPERTGKLRQSTLSGGVRGGNGEYYVGSYTDYAKYPYTMNNETTHWTTPGTNSYWFKEYWQKHGKAIFQIAVEESLK